ncbi:hypothetical protein HPB51_021141 [Rhipicephalus microplus]|uniref:Uncharacterized protein n=1 Tax=Rhipicephalus microplus TaxID=6941 RepID=A0A9J6DXC6_RHIMP|nr:hypothetical protein HPB51_021141 [Rhipicephalus microplus]
MLLSAGIRFRIKRALVSVAEAEVFAKSLNPGWTAEKAPYFETSSATGENIDQVFDYIFEYCTRIDLNDAQLQELIVTKRNPSALEVKRIRNTTAVTILFQGMQVPKYVCCIVRCVLFCRHTEVCYNCGRLCHRAVVCPNPNTMWCRKCRLKMTPENRQCRPHCTLCSGPHPITDKDCKREFQVLYIVYQRRRRKCGDSRSRGQSGASFRDSSATSNTSTTSRRSRCLTLAARRCSAQRSHSRSRRHCSYHQAELTWADPVQGKQQPQRSTPPIKRVTWASLPEQESETVSTVQELAGLLATIQQLTTQLNEARQQI